MTMILAKLLGPISKNPQETQLRVASFSAHKGKLVANIYIRNYEVHASLRNETCKVDFLKNHRNSAESHILIFCCFFFSVYALEGRIEQ